VLTEGAKFCTSCGASAPLAETTAVYAPETRPFPIAQADPIAQPDQGYAGGTEDLRQTASPVSNYNTEEMPQPVITAPVEERAATVGIEAPVTRPQTMPAAARQVSGGRKGLAAVVALGLVVLAAGAYFLAGSPGLNGFSETQASIQLADAASPAASAQPTVQPSIAVEKAQTTPQPDPTIGEVKPAAKQSNEAESKSQSQQARGEEKSAAQAAQEKKGASGTGAAEHNVNQGIEYMSGGKYQEALREFEYVKKLDPENKNVYYLIGQAYHKMNQLNQALDAYRQCTSGMYASVAQSNVKMLEKRLGKTN
jgi:hypothetical protein